ncbi:MAG: peptidoglycan-binding protein [Clostridiales bacterium]|jgi:hypothetical protein|nr:peptidoglycan-binding protein [Clostridiales bacterium]
MAHNQYHTAAADQGRLQIGAFDLNQGRPAAGVTINVTTSDGMVIDELVTDDSGQTAEIYLHTPPLSYSMEAGQPRPYDEYGISASVEGYEPVRISGVQILPDCSARQDVYLQPAAAPGESATIRIPPPALWGSYPQKIPEDPAKELPAETGFVVLPDPVVPEYIVVHAGTPANTGAQNYFVPFKDYIKNVASCEIYANWPEETLKANVMAILSFTLNRVYTEWYRSRGYNFTITNSTAYDQAFAYGRNIFREISNVVDSMFTSFITRPGIRQPLLAQYCDGKRVNCEPDGWMSQWGSKELGDRGYGMDEILKSFYGYDIYFMQAKLVDGVPYSFSGNNLQMGSRGQDVRTIQEQLNAISNNYPAIKKIRVDGIFGDRTLEAVKKFQTVFQLPASGIVDFPTWYRISDIYVAVTRMAELI